MSVAVNTSSHLYDDFLCLLLLHAHREASALAGELPRNLISFVSCALPACLTLRDQFDFIQKPQQSAMRVTISIDLSTWS